jgi:hypothetical protein
VKTENFQRRKWDKKKGIRNERQETSRRERKQNEKKMENGKK